VPLRLLLGKVQGALYSSFFFLQRWYLQSHLDFSLERFKILSLLYFPLAEVVSLVPLRFLLGKVQDTLSSSFSLGRGCIFSTTKVFCLDRFKILSLLYFPLAEVVYLVPLRL
jgi:hypothetical protein